MRSKPHPMVRIALLVTGIVLLAAAPLVGMVPGPGGVFLAAAGIILILRNSRWARRRFVRLKARWPRVGGFIDRILIRGSAKRRRQRAKGLAAN
jgi:predicted membrane metal-binding protein